MKNAFNMLVGRQKTAEENPAILKMGQKKLPTLKG